MRSLSKILIVMLPLLMLSGCGKKPLSDTLASAEAWVAIVDAGDYKGSWSAASGVFKKAVTTQDWEKAATTAREPLGKMVSRKYMMGRMVTALPGVPDGNYAVLAYRSSFEKKKSAVETVTMVEESGVWKATGYYIK